MQRRSMLVAAATGVTGALWTLSAFSADGDKSKFRRSPTQYIAALGDPGANSGTGAQTWGGNANFTLGPQTQVGPPPDDVQQDDRGQHARQPKEQVRPDVQPHQTVRPPAAVRPDDEPRRVE